MVFPAKLRSFGRTFWVANVMELFERAAYYGLNSVLAIYLVGRAAEGGLGFDEQSVGLLQGIVYAATYVIPIAGGALADRYGYRRTLLVAFCLLSAGYWLAGMSTRYGSLLFFLLVMAAGGGLFKPIISGTIARTTDERTSALGFGIYYWVINLGALAAPLAVSKLRAVSWQWVFFASALYTGAMLLPALWLYRDPPRPVSAQRLREALRGVAEVLGDSRFMLMVITYSTFWILYFQSFGTLLWYLGDFIDMAEVNAAVNRLFGALGLSWSFHFEAEHVTVVNALMIILLQFAVSRIVERRSPLPVMVAGMVIGAGGFALLALSQSPWVFIAGIAVFTLGEMTAHPKYFSFVGQVAPADRKAIYMGYSFLYGVFGALIGSNLGGAAYKAYLKPAAHTPAAPSRAAAFWAAFVALDLAAAAALFGFARAFGADSAGSRRRARKIMLALYGLIAFAGALFFASALRARPVETKTAAQAVLFVALGAGGLLVSLQGARTGARGPSR